MSQVLPYKQLKKVSLSLETEIGKISSFSHGSADPEKYLSCIGGVASREEYHELFAKIGTTFGTGDGLTTFGLPNLIDQFIRGNSSTRAIGNVQEDATAKNGLSVATGGGNKYSSYDGKHTHTFPVGTWHGYGGRNATSGNSDGSHGTTEAPTHRHYTNIDHGHTIAGDSETRPRNMAVEYYIRSKK